MARDFTHHGEHHDAAGDAKCPVCRALVNSASAPSRLFDGETWFFCDGRCLDAFLKRPAYYAARARAERKTGTSHVA